MAIVKQQTTLRVVVVTYFPGDSLPAFLSSLATASQSDVPVTVVDNGSTDGTVEYVRDHPSIELIDGGGNRGYGAAANLGAADAVEDWLIIANPDLTFSPSSVDELLAVTRRWPKAGVLGPRIHTPDGRLYPSARELPSLGRGVGHAALGWVWPANPWTASYRRERGAPVESTAGWVSGACMLIRREAFMTVGGFDEGYFMYFEDTDLCERIAAAGWDVVYAPSAVVEHQGGQATSTRAEAMSKAHHDSAYRYLARKYSGAPWAPVRGLLRVSLWGRFQLSRRVARVGHGAKPTREA
ncbi:glycosyltransferase family 2 protein [Lapillicoccus sp.]|uniref:glycosyltransferase family 2 protein n=1 Tax=Lapillicoccus sp. TaxID=1909287 RepID=UPI003264F0F7